MRGKSRIDANGQSLLNVFPLPNFTDRRISRGNYNYVFAAPMDNTQLSDTLKIDYNLRSNDILTGSVSYYDNPAIGQLLSVNWPQFTYNLRNHPTTVSIRETHIFSPMLLNEVRVAGLTQPADVSYDADALKANQRDAVGFRAGQLYPSSNPLGLLPNSAFGGVTAAAKLGVEPRFPRFNRYQVLSLSDNVTWNKGVHIVKAGFYYESLLSLRVPICESFRLMPPSWFLRFWTDQAYLG